MCCRRIGGSANFLLGLCFGIVGFGAILGGLLGGFVLELFGTQVLTIVSLGSLSLAMMVLMFMVFRERRAYASPT